mmetsp:Transcript_5159/g.11062  ORF Transcript_5159/g.11062 Transcript_5159/m.11062 type:complete len:270 (+) Transcript_5159:359-1168(+)
MITISQVFFVCSTSTVIGISCALAVPRTWAAEAALSVGIVIIVVAMCFITSRLQEVNPRRGKRIVDDSIPPGLSDLTRSESSHLDYCISRNDDGDSNQAAHLWQRGEHSLEGICRQESALPIERQGSGGSVSDFDLDDSIHERTQTEIRRLTTCKDPARVLTSAHQLFLHDVDGKWALFTARNSKRNPKQAVLEVSIQNRKARKISHIIFDDFTKSLIVGKNKIVLPEADKTTVMKSLNLLCKITRVKLDCVNGSSTMRKVLSSGNLCT